MASDEEGVFAVVEAILVAVLILTAILFFTSVQRPTTGSEARGIDLGQVSSDTLGILERRNFTGGTQADLAGWVTKVIDGDAATATAVDTFLNDVLPTGAQHRLRLSNGVGNVTLLPATGASAAHGARAAQLPFFVRWQSYAGQRATGVASPGEQPAAGSLADLFTQPAGGGAVLCIQAPDGSTSGPGGVAWASSTYWKATPGWIPAWAPYGIWKGGTTTSGSPAVCGGTITYLAIVLPGSHGLTDGVVATPSPGLQFLRSASYTFTSADIGRLVVGTGTNFPAGSTITAVASCTPAPCSQATLSATATAGTSLSVALALDPTYSMYGLELVVWFGA